MNYLTRPRRTASGESFDLIVLGAGVAGLSIAIAAAKRGKKVLILDRKGLKGQATPAAAGILDPTLEMKPDNPLLKISLEANRRYAADVREIEKASGQSIGYRQTGMVYVALNDSECRKLRKTFRWQRKLPMPVRWLEHRQLMRHVPSVTVSARAGLYYPATKIVKAAQFKAALDCWARRLKIPMERVSQAGEILRKNGKVIGVRHKDQQYLSSRIVIAAGAWSGKFVVPARGQILILRKRNQRIPTIIHSLDGTYIVPWTDREYLLGSTVEFNQYHPTSTRVGIRSILQRAKKLVPGIDQLKTVKTWAGLRPYSKDGLPLIGETSVNGLYLLTGFFKSGILIGYHAGRQLSEEMFGKTKSDLKPFSPKRFGI